MSSIKKFVKSVYVAEKMKGWLHLYRLGFFSDNPKTLTLQQWKEARSIYLASTKHIEEYYRYKDNATGIKL